MNQGRRNALVGFFALTTAALADNFVNVSPSHAPQAKGHSDLKKVADTMLDEIVKQNDYYSSSKGIEFFQKFQNKQIPRATVVGCSDSRFQEGALDATPENDLFVIRNIGNQISSNMGSVDYGVHHLHTPLLLVVGHSRCGAVKAALSDYTGESAHIRKELDSLSLSMRRVSLSGKSDVDWLNGVIENVHQQVAYAKASYHEEVESGKLTIVGVVYDLGNDLKAGYGKVRIININGETNPSKIQSLRS